MESFTVKTTPKTVANKALQVIKRARLSGLKLKESRVTSGSDGFQVFARWEEGGFFGSSAELRLEAEKAFNGTKVEITTYSEKCASLVERLRHSL